MTIHIQKIDPQAQMPKYAHPGDAGMDVFSNEQVNIGVGERKAIRTGIAMQVPDGYVALVWDKSGRAIKEGLKVMAGVIDSGYRGEVQIVLVNLGTEEVCIQKGEKIAQILIQPVISATIQEVQEFNDDTSRGTDGFGSTGI